jgi:hypothetical protein
MRSVDAVEALAGDGFRAPKTKPEIPPVEGNLRANGGSTIEKDSQVECSWTSHFRFLDRYFSPTFAASMNFPDFSGVFQHSRCASADPFRVTRVVQTYPIDITPADLVSAGDHVPALP